MAGVCTSDLSSDFSPSPLVTLHPLSQCHGGRVLSRRKGFPGGLAQGCHSHSGAGISWQKLEQWAGGRAHLDPLSLSPCGPGESGPTCTGGRGRRNLGMSPHMPGFGYYQVGALSWGPWVWYPHS